jgi:hypothetical protein
MAFGISTLCLCDALCRNISFEAGQRPHLVVIDPFQHGNIWQGVGLAQIRSAGFDDLVQFHERTSQAMLPELAAKDFRIQFAFIDGSHMFDEVLIDFFYLDQMLEIGGVSNDSCGVLGVPTRTQPQHTRTCSAESNGPTRSRSEKLRGIPDHGCGPGSITMHFESTFNLLGVSVIRMRRQATARESKGVYPLQPGPQTLARGDCRQWRPAHASNNGERIWD